MSSPGKLSGESSPSYSPELSLEQVMRSESLFQPGNGRGLITHLLLVKGESDQEVPFPVKDYEDEKRSLCSAAEKSPVSFTRAERKLEMSARKRMAGNSYNSRLVVFFFLVK